jgi:hypothetical protein
MKLPYPPRGRASQLVVVCALLGLGVGLAIGAGPDASRAASSGPLVSAYPIPGDQVASPQSQLAFRGLPASQLGTITVRGSKSGVHTGTIEPDSDNYGGSFVPAKPFTPGETVTVTTSLDIRRAPSGSYRFTVAQPLNPIRLEDPGYEPRTSTDVQHFHSRPDLQPVAVSITKNDKGTAPGYIFLGPQAGPVSDGPMIIGSDGHLVWYKPLPRNEIATDVRVQTYEGQPVLTWWQGGWNAGIGRGEGVISNTAYEVIKYVKAANGMDADLHEFQITRNGVDALVTAYYPVWWNESSVGGPKRGIVFDAVVQEIDIATGLVVFQWDSLDHVPLTASTGAPPKDAGHPYNYFHINSVVQDDDGNLIVSGRNTSAAYKISIGTGGVIWTLGGKYSSFKFGRGASFAFQHDVEVRARGDGEVSMFDDGAGPPDVHSASRGLELRLNVKQRTATVAGQDLHSPSLLAQFEGNDQALSNGDSFIGWGEQPYFSEYNSRGQLVFDGHFVGANTNYRAYRFRWNGTPQTSPALAVTLRNGTETAYASWNGATEVTRWRVLGGASTTAMTTIATARVTNFETAIGIHPEAYVEVQALGSHGQVLGTSQAERPQ